MCCDEILSRVPHFFLLPIGHVLLSIWYLPQHIHVCLLLNVSCWPIFSNRLIFLGTVVSVYYFTVPVGQLGQTVQFSSEELFLSITPRSPSGGTVGCFLWYYTLFYW